MPRPPARTWQVSAAQWSRVAGAADRRRYAIGERSAPRKTQPTRKPTSCRVLEDAKDGFVWNFCAPVEEFELDEKCQGLYRSSELADKRVRRRRCSAGRQHIIDDEHTLSRLHRVGVNLEAIRAVFKIVGLLNRFRRQLSFFPHGCESGAEPIRNSAAQN